MRGIAFLSQDDGIPFVLVMFHHEFVMATVIRTAIDRRVVKRIKLKFFIFYVFLGYMRIRYKYIMRGLITNHYIKT